MGVIFDDDLRLTNHNRFDMQMHMLWPVTNSIINMNSLLFVDSVWTIGRLKRVSNFNQPILIQQCQTFSQHTDYLKLLLITYKSSMLDTNIV